jgi:hypothetical protein
MRRRHSPEVIVDRTLLASGRDASKEVVRPLAAIAHLAFGATTGAAFGLLARGAGWARVLEGIGFGLLVWHVSYRGWLPALGLMPHADEDERGRRWTVLAAHGVYGAVLGGASSATPRLG